MSKNFKEVGRWWNDSSIELIEKDGAIYALYGWNGESYIESWKCVGDHNMDAEGKYKITPWYIQKGDNEDEFEIYNYVIIER